MKPRVIIFNGISLDGRMDGGTGQVDMGLYYGLAATWNADAMLSGSATMLAAFAGMEDASPQMPSDPKDLYPNAIPFLAVVDSRGQIHNWPQIQAQPYWGQAVALCSQATPKDYLAGLETTGIPCIVAGEERVDLAEALEQLNVRFGVQTVRVDSGGVLNGALLRAGLVDEVSVLLDPILVGGTSPRTLFTAPDVTSSDQVIPLRLVHCEQVKPDILWLRYEIRRELRNENGERSEQVSTNTP